MDGQDIVQALTFALLFVAAVIVFISLPVWLLWQIHKATHAGKHWHLASKLWYCQQCWYYEYLRVTRECPKCAERFKKGEHWISVEEMVRGQPSKVEYYKTKQRITLTEAED